MSTAVEVGPTPGFREITVAKPKIKILVTIYVK